MTVLLVLGGFIALLLLWAEVSRYALKKSITWSEENIRLLLNQEFSAVRTRDQNKPWTVRYVEWTERVILQTDQKENK